MSALTVITDVPTVAGKKRPGSSDTLTPLVPMNESLIVPAEWSALDIAYQVRRGDKTESR